MQSYIKFIIRNKDCISRFINIANACIDLGHQLSHFKTSIMVIIPKPNKISFDLLKLYCPIILLNIIRKLFEKMIREHLQFHMISNNFIHLSQLRDLKQRSTTDAEVILTHIIQLGWIKNLTTSTLVFDIAQFFSSLNYQLLLLILDKMELDCKILMFFKNYLVERKIKYLQNNFISLLFNVNVGQLRICSFSDSFCSLFISCFYSLENHLKNTFSSFILSMIDYLFLKTNPYHIFMQTFFVVTI